jgi:hypothetical protein
MPRTVLLVAALVLSSAAASAQPPKIDRTIAKEPVYQTRSPKYGLLVFGPEARDRVWLVLDGDTLYVDRNGNGDLTEPGEKITAKKTDGRDPAEEELSFEVGDLTVGERVHKGLSVDFTPLKMYNSGWRSERRDVRAALARDPKAAVASVSVDVDFPGIKGSGVGGRVTCQTATFDLVGILQFADKPAAAPVIHFGGPLQITFYGGLPVLRVGRETELVLVVGTPGIGPGTFAMVQYQDAIPDSLRPTAEVTLPLAKAGAGPLKEKFEIKQRC